MVQINDDAIQFGVGFEHGRHYDTVYTCPYCCSDDIDYVDDEEEK